MKVIIRATGKPAGVDLLTLNPEGAMGVLRRIATKEWAADTEALNLVRQKAGGGKKAPSSSSSNVLSVVHVTREERYRAFTDPPSGKEIDPDTTFVIPTFQDYGTIRLKQAEVKKHTGIELTESQTWALVLAEIRGAYDQERNRRSAVARLTRLNKTWNTPYTEGDLDAILHHLATGTRLATNYTFSQRPGANTNSKGDPRLLGELLMQDTQFRNVWETRASQAAVSDKQRGAVEEAMGYGAVLRRLEGAPLHQSSSPERRKKEEGQFSPLNNRELPKYAALVSRYQLNGVATRYGPSVVYWKPSLRWRITHTPGDSWNTNMAQGAYHSYTSPRYPEALLAHTEEILVRLAAAEATGKDAAFLNQAREKGISTDAYIETQIHGDLGWVDVEQLVIGDKESNAQELKERFIRFRDRAGYDFTVTGRPPSFAAQRAPAIAEAAQDNAHMVFQEWIRFEHAGYQDSDWTDFLGALTVSQQLAIALYLTKECTSSLLAQLRKRLPAALLPGGRVFGAVLGASASPSSSFPSPSLSRKGAQDALAIVQAVEDADHIRLNQWLHFESITYDDTVWGQFLDALDAGGHRRIGIYLMEECTESLLARLRQRFPAALLSGGRVLQAPARAPVTALLPVPKPLGSEKASSPSSKSAPVKKKVSDGTRGLLTPQGPVASGITRVACLSQERNTCGQRAAYNAIAFLQHPNNAAAAAQAMANHDALHRFGPMAVDIYDEEVRDLLDHNGGRDVALVWNLEHIQQMLMDETLIADDGDHALYSFLHRRRRTVQVVINTHAMLDPSSVEQILAASSVSHYFAAELHWSDTGALEIQFADSLVNAEGSQALVEELKLSWS